MRLSCGHCTMDRGAAVGQYGLLHLCGLFDYAVCFSLILCTVDGRAIGDLVIWKVFSTRQAWHSRGPASEIYCRSRGRPRYT
jgi:hypothetical protein